MVVLLQEEQKEDEAQKKWCETEFDTSEDKEGELKRKIAGLEAAIAEMKEGIATLKDDIKALSDGIVALDKSRKCAQSGLTYLRSMLSVVMKRVLGFPALLNMSMRFWNVAWQVAVNCVLNCFRASSADGFLITEERLRLPFLLTLVPPPDPQGDAAPAPSASP